MEAELEVSIPAAPLAAMTSLVLFLAAIIVALAVTLLSEPPPVRLLAGALVLPIVALSGIFLYFERRARRWSFLGAAVLGAVGVGLRLTISTQPQLEVGGGLPIEVTVAYVALGASVVATSAWAYRAIGPMLQGTSPPFGSVGR